MSEYKKLVFSMVLFLSVPYILGGCGPREPEVRHHTMEDVIAALENAGFEILWRASQATDIMVSDEDTMADVAEATRTQYGVEAYDRLAAGEDTMEVFIFDLSAPNAQANIERAMEDAGPRRRLWRHDNILYCIAGHPDAEAVRQAIEGL